jgi:hypothetical protein
MRPDAGSDGAKFALRILQTQPFASGASTAMA